MTTSEPTARSTVGTTPMPTASVVVCAYTMQRWDDIVAGMRALSAQSLRPLDIVLVVDHNDELLVRARELTATTPTLHVRASTGPPGLSGARNTGVEQAQGELVAFLDDDAEPEADWLERLLAPFGDPAVMVTGGQAVPRWPDARPEWFPREFDWVVGCSYVGMPTVEAEVRNVIGAAMAIRRRAFDSAGLFADGIGRTSTLPLGCEETELCIRIRKALPEARVVYVPESVVDHRVSEDRVRVRYFVRRCLSEGISKDQISVLVGNDAATSTELAYATRTLPAGVLRGLAGGLRGHRYSLYRAAMIVVGLAVTTYGFSLSKLRRATGNRGRVRST